MAFKNLKPSIAIPKADDNEIFNVPKGKFGDIRKKFEKIDQILFGIMIAVVLSMIAIIVSVIGLFIDQMRYNNAAYRDYSEKMQSVNETQTVNQLLFKHNNENQQLILDQQKQILDLLKK